MEDDKVVFSDFLLAYAKTRPTISPEIIQAEAQTLYTRLIANPDSLKICYTHFLHNGSNTGTNPVPRKRKRIEEPKPKPRKRQKVNDDLVVDLTHLEVEPKRHVTRSRAKRSGTQNQDPIYAVTEKRSSSWVGVLPKGPTQWMGVVQYRKKKSGSLKEKRTPGCLTEQEALGKIHNIVKRVQAKGYTLTREGYGHLLSSGSKQVKSLEERNRERKKRTNMEATDPNDVIVIETEYPKTSKYSGVDWDYRVERWLASIQTRTSSKRLIRGGYFKDQTKAARKVNELCVRNGMSPLNPSLCVNSNSQKQVAYGKRSRYVGIIYSPGDDQWTCELKHKKENGKRIYRAQDGHGLWDSDEEELVKHVRMEVFRLKQEGYVPVDFEYATTKLTLAPESKYVGIEFDIDHGRWACWIEYRQPNSDIVSSKFIGYQTDQHKLAQTVRNWVNTKRKDSKTKWDFAEEYGVNKINFERRNRQRRGAEAPRGDKDLYEVERIIEWKITPEGRKYHVKWASAEDEYTWEPEEHVQHLEIFRDFHRRHIERVQQQRELDLQRKHIKPSHTFPSSCYKGVTFDTRDGKWHAAFTRAGRTLRGGAFDNEAEAATAVNALCRQANQPALNRISGTGSQLLWIRTNGTVYFPTNRKRRSLRPECMGSLPDLELDNIL